MDSFAIISLVLSSGFMSVIISSLFVKNLNDKNQCLKYITEERQKWRVKVKENIAIFCNSDDKKQLKAIKTEMHLSLNPNDNEDKKIMTIMQEIIVSNDNDKIMYYKDKLEELICQLLKHDWERAKKEAKSFSRFRPEFRRIITNCNFPNNEEIITRVNNNKIIIAANDDSFSKLYDWLTIFATVVPLGLFIGRVFVKNRINIELYQVNIVIGILLILTIVSIYFMIKDERYKLYIGDTKCQVGGMLIGLVLTYFMRNTENFNDILVNFTLIITALFFISDGMSDMNSILDTMQPDKKIFNDPSIKISERVEIIKILNNTKFIITLVFMIATLMISINIIQFYLNIVNMDQSISNSLLYRLIGMIGILGVVIPTIPVSSKLLKLVCVFAKNDIHIATKEDIRVIIINTLTVSYKSKTSILLLIAYYFLIAIQWHYLNSFIIVILVSLPILTKIGLLKIIGHKLDRNIIYRK